MNHTLQLFKTSDHVAFITGAVGGLGTAFCQALSNSGSQVVAGYHPEHDDINLWISEQKAMGYNFLPVPCDVSNTTSCIHAAHYAQELVSQPIDIVINNAGITRDKFFQKMDSEQWHSVINTNLNSVYNVTQPFIKPMIENGWGRIINISSVNGVKGQAGQTNYAAAKAGLIGFTKSLAGEVANKGITVNAIAPGYVATKMVTSIREDILQNIINEVPMKRLAKPEEIAAAAVFLASDAAAFITGATLNINGGLYYQ